MIDPAEKSDIERVEKQLATMARLLESASLSPTPEGMTMRQLMDYIHIQSQQTIFNYMEGRGCSTPLPYRCCGENLRFFKADVDAWMLSEAEARKLKKKAA